MQTCKKVAIWLLTALCIAVLVVPSQRLIAQEPADTDNNGISEETSGEETTEWSQATFVEADPLIDLTSDLNQDNLLPSEEQPAEFTKQLYLPLIQVSNNDAASLVEAASSLATLVNNIPVVLIASTGNLYWTQHDQADDVGGGLITASIYRTSKDRTPGGEIRLLYAETEGANHIWPAFSGLAYAKVGDWYGYFIATYQGCSASCPAYIKRIPLAGGAATTLVQLPAAAASLQTDGTYLYWADATAVYRMAIQGGAITKLANRSGSPMILELGTSNVYFVDAGRLIKRVPKTGGTVTTVAIAASIVTDLYVYVQPTQTAVYWSEVNAAVRSKVVGGSTTTYQGALTNKTAKSVGFDGSHVFWLTCSTTAYGGCTLTQRQGSVTTLLVSSSGNYSDDLVWDATQIFWGCITGIKKYVR